MTYIYGGDTGMTYEQMLAARKFAETMRNTTTPQNVGEGWGAIMKGFAGRLANKSADAAETQGKERANSAYTSALGQLYGKTLSGGGMGGMAPAPTAPVAPVDPASPDAIAADAMSALGKGGDWLRYSNSGATRSQPINDNLKNALSFLPDLGVTMEVFSGGQAGQGTGGPRTGSTRHDHGNAADVFFYKDGRRLDWSNPQDQPLFQEIVRRGKAAGVTGFGAGDGYMQPGSMHIGFGAPAVWGAGGKGSNAPQWLRSAYGDSQPSQQPQERVMPAQAGGDMAVLMGAMSDPYMSEQQRSILGMLLQQQMQSADPMRQLQMEKLRKDIETGGSAGTAGMQEYQLAKSQGFQGTFMDFKAAVAGASNGDGTEYGLSPQYGVDAQGNPVLIQLGKDGTTTMPKLPEGVQLSKEPIKLDAGTHFVLLDPITRQPVGTIPKENREAAAETAIGTAQGKSQGELAASAPAQVANADVALKGIEDIRKDPALGRGTGLSSFGNMLPGTSGRGFQARVDQLKGGAFLTAIQQLQGMGALSNSEGQTATAAIARLDTAQTQEDFLAALADYEAIVKAGRDRAMGRMGQAPATPPAEWTNVGNGVKIRVKQ